MYSHSIYEDTVQNQPGEQNMASSSSSNYFQQKLLDLICMGIAYTPPSTMYVALFTAMPTYSTAGTEVSTSGTAYARQSILCTSPGSGGWTGPTGTNLTYSNQSNIVYATPTATWGTIVGAGLFDASTGGNLLYFSQLSTPKTVNNGDGAPQILAGQLQLTRATC